MTSSANDVSGDIKALAECRSEAQKILAYVSLHRRAAGDHPELGRYMTKIEEATRKILDATDHQNFGS